MYGWYCELLSGGTDLGVFVGGPGVHPMLQWHGTWRGIAVDQELSVLGAARLFAMLSTVASDVNRINMFLDAPDGSASFSDSLVRQRQEQPSR